MGDPVYRMVLECDGQELDSVVSECPDDLEWMSVDMLGRQLEVGSMVRDSDESDNLPLPFGQDS